MKKMIAGNRKDKIIPDELIEEGIDFSFRNSLGEVKGRKNNIKVCCPACLKAHLLKFAKEKAFGKKVQSYLSLSIEGDIGHMGYYQDKEDLVFM
tara:strand:- start:152 stop:433 length:282 start_codon:yes stop_codon:yes gene_type:complete